VIRAIFLSLAFLLLLGCALPSTNKFSDSTLVKIADFQDRRQADSLIRYLLHKNQIYRAEAARALGSVQDSAASLQLGSMLLEDPYIPARVNAAFALGQTGGNAAVNALIPALTDTRSLVIDEVLQGLGKTITYRDLPTLTHFIPKDSIQEQGLVWGFYFAGLRGVTDSTMELHATDFLSFKHCTSVRLGAAHFFNRVNNVNSLPTKELVRSAIEDRDPFVQMAATLSLRKVITEEHLPALKTILTTENDYRVRVSAARVVALKSTEARDELTLIALKDENTHVAVTAAENIRPDYTRKKELLDIARTTKNFRVQAALYKVMAVNSQEVAQEIRDVYSDSTNPYHKASLLNALSSDISSYSFLGKELIESNSPVIKTSAAQALSAFNRTGKFKPELKSIFADIYKKAVLHGDPGVIGIVATVLADSSLNYKDVIQDYGFLHEAKNKLKLPKDFEAIQPLEEAIAYFEGSKKPATPKNEFNHPINWSLVKQLPKDQRITINTEKGKIIIQLWVEDAPGSVANFVDLVNQKYFDEKFVHRVVPNFVMQTGCARGDGYGGEAYSIRSEFALRRYAEGSVGMASAGKDTEGTQWFITHSPTPHLDGRYTLFATVVSGMDVVHKIEVGDKILSLQLTNN